ncbi:PAS domain S-box protein [Microvirga subterranea]|uniref:Blue-light-activated histidine kinase n=1 Tax=Microvirga subterranea TaxID=186651 RepID=A0A370HBK4_9HYPH|nr:PAS domain S-box protein [Microvirga subterranea]RDI53593.1 PAS domain S-box-containing protein [Microvirga subterranea]
MLSAGPWPQGEGEMAARIRSLGWADTPLGPIETWPQSLRTTVDLILAMPGPATILWGPKHVQIYNDAYIAIAKERHPALLGRPVVEGWPDVYKSVIAPILESASAGRATRLTGFPVPLAGLDSRLEERVFDTDWSPIRDESGAVAGALQTLVEVSDRLEVQAALRESEARHRLLIESWTQAVWETDADGVVVADSPSWRAYTGQTLDEWLGYGWLDAIHPDDRAYAERQWREAVAARALVNAEFRLRAPDGEWRWTNVRAAPVLDAEGRVEKWAGMNIDIDDRKRTEAALRENEERYRTLFESMDEGYLLSEVILDENDKAIDIRFLEANPAAVRLAGRDFTGQRMREIDPRYEEYWYEAYGRVALTGEPIRAEHYAEPHGRWFDFRLSKVGPPESKRVASVHQDVTERKSAEQALRESEKRYRSLFATMDEGYALCELVRDDQGRAVDYRYLEVNRAFETLTGLASSQVNGRLRSEAIPVPDERRLEASARVIASGEPTRLEYFNEGLGRWYEVGLFPREGDQFAALFADITERKRAEIALRESEERLRDVLNSMAEGFALLGPDFTILDVNTETVRLDGRRRDELVGRSHWDAFPGTEHSPVGALFKRVVRERVPEALEHQYAWPNGRALWLDLRVYPTPGGIAIFWRDITDRKRADEALRASEQRYRALFESMDEAYAVVEVLKGQDGTWADFRFLEVNPAFIEHTSMPYPVGKTATELLGTPNPRWAQLYGQALDTGKPLRVEEREPTLGRTFDLNIFSLDRQQNRVAVLFTNITERREWEERLQVLVAELQHRTRNLLGVVRSIADRTLAGSSSLDEFQERFRDRIGALSRVNGLLSRLEESTRISFDELLQAELAGHGVMDGDGHGQVTLEGPTGIRLRSATVQTFALGLHELATNAVKHGALSLPEGRLLVRWGLVDGKDGDRRLQVEWQESGVPVPPPARGQHYRRGSGRELIERSLPYQLGAETSYELTPEGVRCTIILPLSTTHREAEHA